MTWTNHQRCLIKVQSCGIHYTWKAALRMCVHGDMSTWAAHNEILTKLRGSWQRRRCIYYHSPETWEKTWLTHCGQVTQSDTIWHQRDRSSLIQVMTWGLYAPGHHMNQYLNYCRLNPQHQISSNVFCICINAISIPVLIIVGLHKPASLWLITNDIILIWNRRLIHGYHFVIVPSQWETTSHCNVISHWLGTFTKWSMNTWYSIYSLCFNSISYFLFILRPTIIHCFLTK